MTYEDGDPVTSHKTVVYHDDKPIGCIQEIKLVANAKKTLPELEITFPDLVGTQSRLVGQIDDNVKTLSKIANANIILEPLRWDVEEGLMTITVPATQLAQNFAGTLTLDRPSDATLDRQFPLAPQTDGTQTLNISKLTAGLWLARVKWNAGGESYFIEQKIKI